MTTTTPQTQSRKPDLVINTKVRDGRNDRIGSRIGVGFYHKDGKGLNIILDAQPIPLDSRIELVAFPLTEKGDA